MPSTSPDARQYLKDATYEQQIRKITQDMEPRIRRAFLAAMADIKQRAQMGRLRDALRSNDIAGAVDALGIDPGAMVRLQSLIAETYGRSGAATINRGPWGYTRFNTLSPRSETWIRENATALAVELSDEARALARDTIADGYAFGRGFDRIARDLVGRIGPSGRRTGGIVGLDPQSMRWVNNLAGYLEADPKRALGMKLTPRDRAFIQRVIARGDRLTAAQIEGILRRYENTMLMARGMRIARTETINAIESGKADAWREGMEKAGIPDEFLLKKWVHTGRAAIDRPEHEAMSGQVVRGIETAFVSPDGIMMRYPHDTTLGAGAEHTINCMCRADYSIDKKGLLEWRA
jgi:hypothetical protein